jgi:hypothetical protein
MPSPSCALTHALLGLAAAIEPLLGQGRSIALWSLGDDVRLLHAGAGSPGELVRAAESRLAEGATTFEITSGPGVCGVVHVCGADDERVAFGLFLEGAGQPHLEATLDRLIDMAERGMQKRVEEMSRTEKQQLVKFLDERGAFLIRRAVADVADRLGVTRFTIYNYLDREA